MSLAQIVSPALGLLAVGGSDAARSVARLAVVACLFIVPCSAQTFTGAVPPPLDRYDLSIADGLAEVLAADSSTSRHTDLALRALYLATEADRPALYELVARAAENGAVTGIIALETLWRLGEAPDYFAGIIHDWDQDSTEARALGGAGHTPKLGLALVAGKMLARTPTDEYIALLDSIDTRGRREFRARIQAGLTPTIPFPTGFNSITGEIRRVRDLQAEYSTLQTDAERVAFAVSQAVWGASWVHDISAHIHPVGAIGRVWLRDLSEQSPALVAAGILAHIDRDLKPSVLRQLKAVRAEFAAEKGAAPLTAQQAQWMRWDKESLQDQVTEVRAARIQYFGWNATAEVRSLLDPTGRLWVDVPRWF